MCCENSNCSCCFCVSTSTVAMVENCGKFSHIAHPGCTILFPCVESIRAVVPLQVQFAYVRVETKTKDNAVVQISTYFHYQVIEECASTAFYRFSNPADQIASFASSVVRGEVPKYTLDELFLTSEEIKRVVDEELRDKLREFGYKLVSTLITDIDPSSDVKQAISQSQINSYLRTAAEHQAEINRIVTVKEAEADFEEKRLSGVGLAKERAAIMNGLQSSIEQFLKEIPGSSAKKVMNLLLMNQYFDAMKDVAGEENNELILLPGSGSTVEELVASQLVGRAKAS